MYFLHPHSHPQPSSYHVPEDVVVVVAHLFLSYKERTLEIELSTPLWGFLN